MGSAIEVTTSEAAILASRVGDWVGWAALVSGVASGLLGSSVGAIAALPVAVGAGMWRTRALQREIVRARDRLSTTKTALGLARDELSRGSARIDAMSSEIERLRGAEATLEAAKREAEAAALAKGEFLATVSHEVRTPLNGVLPILELVLAQELSSEVRHQVTAALESAREMRRIVNDVLDFAKFESGRLELEVASMRPAEIVQSVANLMKRGADAKGLALVVRTGDSVPPIVRGDALRFRQVVTNFVANAIKFTERGEVRIDLTQHAEDRRHRTLKVAVVDTGRGIAPEARDRLFQPFSQADASTARAHGGTGLGLAICSRIVEAMSGRIGVDSVQGRGSTFWFAAPFLRAAGEVGMDAVEQPHALVLSRDDAFASAWSKRLVELDWSVSRAAIAYEASSQLRATLAQVGGASMLLVIDMVSAARTAAAVVRPLLADGRSQDARVVLVGGAGELAQDAAKDDRIRIVASDAPDAELTKVVRTAGADRGSGDGDAPGPLVRITRAALPRFDGLHVLLVDDIAINRYAGRLTLEKLGVRVTEASGGREAIARLRDPGLSLALLDCQMPDVDGYAATRAHRIHERAEGLTRLPIIAVTANAMPGDREKCLEAGMDDHLAKPIELQAIADVLTRWATRPADAGSRAGVTSRAACDTTGRAVSVL